MKHKIVKTLSLLLTASVLSGMPVYAATNAKTSESTASSVEISKPGTIGTKVMVTYARTVTKSYTSFSSIPQYLYVTEYVAGVKCTGNLPLKSVAQNNGVYVVTFSGYISGSV